MTLESRHWAWLCQGYWRYRSLIDWLEWFHISMVWPSYNCGNDFLTFTWPSDSLCKSWSDIDVTFTWPWYLYDCTWPWCDLKSPWCCRPTTMVWYMDSKMIFVRLYMTLMRVLHNLGFVLVWPSHDLHMTLYGLDMTWVWPSCDPLDNERLTLVMELHDLWCCGG